MGPTYRADVWVALEAAPHLSAAELARRTYASFATAWQVKQDFEILDGSQRKKGRGSVSKEPSVWLRGRRSSDCKERRREHYSIGSLAPIAAQ